MGKSRFVQEVIAHAGTSIAWIEIACNARGRTIPLHPFRDWLDDLDSRELPPDSLIAATDRLGETSTIPSDQCELLFCGLRMKLFAHAPRVGLIIEDVHWADSTTIDFIVEILSTATQGRFFVLMTSRAPVNDALLGSGHLAIEKLERLPPGDAASLARALSAEKRLTSFQLTQIVDHADGVPLFIEEFARAVFDEDPTSDHIPITLRDSTDGVLDSLGAGRNIALCASIFGRRFNYVHLRELLGLDDGELAPAVEALTKAQVLVQAGEMPDALLEFRHVLFRDIAYYTLLKSERERWCHRVAQLAAAGILPIKGSILELLAMHHSLGGSYKSAIDYWLKAQSQAMQRWAVAEALAHIRSGLEDCQNLAKDDPAEAARLELDLLGQLATPLIAVTSWSSPELADIYARAMKLCQAISSEDAEFELQRGLYNLHLLRGELGTAIKR
jgi:predicted ATPase